MDELLQSFAADVSSRLAVADRHRSLTYGELDAAANRLGARLRGLGVRPGALVAVCCERSVDSVVGALAVLRARAADTSGSIRRIPTHGCSTCAMTQASPWCWRNPPRYRDSPG